MSRKTKVRKTDRVLVGKPKVTAPVTLTEAQKAEIAKPIMPDIMQAMDFAASVGLRAGKAEGFAKGVLTPRTRGEQVAKLLESTIDSMLAEVKKELVRAYTKFPKKQASPHEGYAVLAEELDELWDEVKADRGRMSTGAKEAIQVAAMGVRYVIDNTNGPASR